MNPTSKKRETLRLLLENPLAKILIILSVIVVVVFCLLLYFTFYAATARERYNFGAALMGVGGLSQIPIFLLIAYSRNYARILKIVGGDYWVRWDYPAKGEVYFCDEGVYDTDTPYALNAFAYNLEKVEIPPEYSSVIRFTAENVRIYSASSMRKYQQTTDVPIPPGKEAEAQELIERYQGFIGKTSKFTVEQWRYALWMGAGIVGWAALWLIAFGLPLERAYDKELSDRNNAYQAAKLEKAVNEVTPLWNRIRRVVEPRFEKLKTLPDGKLSAKEVGFNENSEVLLVLHGQCENNGFYVSVVLKKGAIKKSYNENITGAFNYTTSSPIPTWATENFCKPQSYFDNRILLSDNWVYGEVMSLPYLPTPSPAANSTTNKVEK